MKDPVLVPVSPAELLDKKTILEVKRERIVAPEKLANVKRELALLTDIARELLAQVDPASGVAQLEAQLLQVNREIWDLENTVRACEQAKDFGEEFVRTARSIYASNDRRAAIKRQINLALGAELIEEKEHRKAPPHGQPAA
ncbi:DUF6165 family protein [Caenimonas aquaedulcis]|uniref:Uncharacterized protein n=1 Tax=Caenimonas aquaedulcis TaxID=2793270 RepID=A0A931MHR9_9BURK|nr:DUF6165 family protein [Caenimonas aquaedulcis]MBG9389103.1 hypothetical protein [Caenimonas aquaedulcis]